MKQGDLVKVKESCASYSSFKNWDLFEEGFPCERNSVGVLIEEIEMTYLDKCAKIFINGKIVYVTKAFLTELILNI